MYPIFNTKIDIIEFPVTLPNAPESVDTAEMSDSRFMQRYRKDIHPIKQAEHKMP